MNLRGKVFAENLKKSTEEKLLARMALLKEKGLSPEAIQRDASVRKIKGILRRAVVRLTAVAAQEKLNADRAQAKVEKLAAAKVAKEKGKEEPKEEGAEKKGKKSKKEKAGKGEPKEKKEKEKKEKPEKKEKAEKEGKEKPPAA
jgi:hypothetical protein